MSNFLDITYILLFLLVVNLILVVFLLIQIKKLTKVTKALDAKTLEQISKDLAEIKRRSEKSLQKIGVVKFNPFNDMGGRLSFAAAILNFLNEGIVISGLHNRGYTRDYVKELSSLKDEKTELSLEEKKAIEKAIKS